MAKPTPAVGAAAGRVSGPRQGLSRGPGGRRRVRRRGAEAEGPRSPRRTHDPGARGYGRTPTAAGGALDPRRPGRPPWADEADVAYAVAEFAWTGFRGGPNGYRAIRDGFDPSAPFAGALIRQPSFFPIGQADGRNEVRPTTTESARRSLPGLRGHLALDGVGHRVPQEAPAATNAALLGFLEGRGR